MNGRHVEAEKKDLHAILEVPNTKRNCCEVRVQIPFRTFVMRFVQLGLRATSSCNFDKKMG